MKKINLGAVLLTAGVLMFLVGLSISYDKSRAIAYANQYEEKYEVTKWRVLRNFGKEIDGTYKCMILGPSEWLVTGSFGDTDANCSTGETCFTETWSVPDNQWHQSDNYLEPGNASETFINVFASGDNVGKSDNSVTQCTFTGDEVALFYNDHWYAYQAGLYGGYAAHKARSGLATNESVGFHSWPKGWKISGSVGSP
ncbi:MAG: hypothetical protein OEV37_01065 [Candidatus Berkelbacteria bacterium]|nr:hypothetical protein [Candidatus Berkelbacteria bacterium]